GFDTPEEVSAARHYVAGLRSRARAHGFGFVDARDRDGKTGRATVMEPHRAAGYLSAYLGESAQLRKAVGVRRSLGRRMRLVWVSPALTRSRACPMRRLRRARILWCYRRSNAYRHGGALSWAGRMPVWLRDPVEHRLVASLVAAAAAP